jgi:hypothetical protein
MNHMNHVRTIFRSIPAGLLLVLVLSVRLLAEAAEPRNGTWELNLAKSKFSPGPAPKSGTRVYEIAGQSIKLVAKGIDAEGKPMLAQYSAKFDGKDYPYPGWADIDTVSLKRIDANTIEATEKLDGKVALTSKNVISKDGKSMTITIKGTNAKGQTVDNILVYDKR